MGRPKKQTVDYFPHFVAGSRKTLFVLEEEWGNNGYAFWFKLLELLCQSDGHYYDVSAAANMRYLSAYTKVEAVTASDILNCLADLGKIDRDLWENHKVIWCESLVENLTGLYTKRTTDAPKKPTFEEAEDDSPEEIVEEPTPPATPEEKPQKPARSKKEEAPKIKYADNVSMTEAEYEKLVEKYGAEVTKKLIDKLDNAKGAKGYKYKSDYRAILNWVVEEVIGKNGGANGYGGQQTQSGAPNPAGFKPSAGFKK